MLEVVKWHPFLGIFKLMVFPCNQSDLFRLLDGDLPSLPSKPVSRDVVLGFFRREQVVVSQSRLNPDLLAWVRSSYGVTQICCATRALQNLVTRSLARTSPLIPPRDGVSPRLYASATF